MISAAKSAARTPPSYLSRSARNQARRVLPAQRRALGPGAHYLSVFRFAGTVAFAGYSLGLLQNSIWYKRNWGTTARGMIDGLVYGLLTAGVFGWLWPR